MNNPPLKTPSNHWKKYKIYYLAGSTFFLLLIFILIINSSNRQEIRMVNQRLSRMEKNQPNDWDFPPDDDPKPGKNEEYGKRTFTIPNPNQQDAKWIEESIPSKEVQQQVRNWINGFKYLPAYKAKFGPETNKHVLLSGPTGSGKSYLARQFCQNESCAWNKVNFETVIYKGTSIAVQKESLKKASAHAAQELKIAQQENRVPRPAVLLIEEIDSVGIKDMTGTGSGAGRDEVNGLLKMFDHIQDHDLNIVMIGTTNYPDALDDALVRPGRFGRRIEVPHPTGDEIEKMVRYVEKTMKSKYGYKTSNNQSEWGKNRNDKRKVVSWPTNFWDQAAQETERIKKLYSKVEITKKDGSKEEVEAETGFAFPDISQIIEECLSAKVGESQAEVVPDINDYKNYFDALMKQKTEDWMEKVMRGKSYHQKKRVPVPPKDPKN